MGKHIHVITERDETDTNGVCRACGPVALVKRSGNRKVCPNGGTVRVGRFRDWPSDIERRARMEVLGDFDGKCEICGDPVATPHVDHDHITGLPRGYLCRPCNLGLGQFRDDPMRLRSAIEYLSREH